MSKMKRDLLKFKEKDLWHVAFFALSKLKDVPEYSTLSELIYILDKESVLKLCEYFGGITMTLPTIPELEVTIKALLLYQYTVIDGMTYDDAVKLLGETGNLRVVKSAYLKICDMLNEYTFSSRGAT